MNARIDYRTLTITLTSAAGEMTIDTDADDLKDLAIAVEGLCDEGVITRAAASLMLSKIIDGEGDEVEGHEGEGYEDEGEGYDDGQPDEAQEWADFDPWC